MQMSARAEESFERLVFPIPKNKTLEMMTIVRVPNSSTSIVAVDESNVHLYCNTLHSTSRLRYLTSDQLMAFFHAGAISSDDWNEWGKYKEKIVAKESIDSLRRDLEVALARVAKAGFRVPACATTVKALRKRAEEV